MPRVESIGRRSRLKLNIKKEASCLGEADHHREETDDDPAAEEFTSIKKRVFIICGHKKTTGS